jgi:phosphate transport system substrate-binding protein
MRLGGFLLGVAFMVLWSLTAWAAEISGAGSTFVYPVLSAWADAYRKGRGVAVDYQPIGSAGGINRIQSKAVDFGASDAPLPPEELDKFGLLQFPLVIGGNVPVVNLPGVEPGALKMTGPMLAEVYLGKITNWSAPAIANINPDLKLPNQDIVVVHRSDGSGTTYIWADYLAKVSTEWKERVGVATTVDWPVGLGGEGNEGVAALVAGTAGAIGYVEYAYAVRNKLSFAQVQNREGYFVQPKKSAFKVAAANANWAEAPAFFLMLTHQPGNSSWPITGSSFVLMSKFQENKIKSKTLLQFFYWVYGYGQQIAEDLDYVPMPMSVARLVESTWSEIKGPDRAPIWPGQELTRQLRGQ